jgi:hypothetical protein
MPCIEERVRAGPKTITRSLMPGVSTDELIIRRGETGIGSFSVGDEAGWVGCQVRRIFGLHCVTFVCHSETGVETSLLDEKIREYRCWPGAGCVTGARPILRGVTHGKRRYGSDAGRPRRHHAASR